MEELVRIIQTKILEVVADEMEDFIVYGHEDEITFDNED